VNLIAIIANYFSRKQFAIIAKMQRRPAVEGKLVCRGKVLPPRALPCGPPVLISACSLVVWPHIQLCIKEKMKGKKEKGGREFLLGKIATARKDSLRKLKKNRDHAVPADAFIS
jgi:hypothetical protein